MIDPEGTFARLEFGQLESKFPVQYSVLRNWGTFAVSQAAHERYDLLSANDQPLSGLVTDHVATDCELGVQTDVALMTHEEFRSMHRETVVRAIKDEGRPLAFSKQSGNNVSVFVALDGKSQAERSGDRFEMSRAICAAVESRVQQTCQAQERKKDQLHLSDRSKRTALMGSVVLGGAGIWTLISGDYIASQANMAMTGFAGAAGLRYVASDIKDYVRNAAERERRTDNTVLRYSNFIGTDIHDILWHDDIISGFEKMLKEANE